MAGGEHREQETVCSGLVQAAEPGHGGDHLTCGYNCHGGSVFEDLAIYKIEVTKSCIGNWDYYERLYFRL